MVGKGLLGWGNSIARHSGQKGTDRFRKPRGGLGHRVHAGTIWMDVEKSWGPGWSRLVTPCRNLGLCSVGTRECQEIFKHPEVQEWGDQICNGERKL